jgi:phosphomevalonate kinase
VISVEAPGKAVIWGEYAVLAGAPALVMALNRYARCSIEPGGENWTCRGLGFDGTANLTSNELLHAEIPPASVALPVAAAARVLGVQKLPVNARVNLDTRMFFAADNPGRKLGIGSSAAICTATCAAMATLLERPLTFADALAAHRWQQNARGSGIDVAAAYYGGLLRFESGAATPFEWPRGLYHQFVWTGVSAATADHVRTFNSWRNAGNIRELDDLCAVTKALFDKCDLDSLRRYTHCLKQLDAAARLGVYSTPHARLDKLANEGQLVYKPCGAGGGDIGVVFSEDREHLNAFENTASEQGFQMLAMEIAEHGIKPTR